MDTHLCAVTEVASEHVNTGLDEGLRTDHKTIKMNKGLKSTHDMENEPNP